MLITASAAGVAVFLVMMLLTNMLLPRVGRGADDPGEEVGTEPASDQRPLLPSTRVLPESLQQIKRVLS